MSFPPLRLDNGILLSCDAAPTFWPCFNESFSCWPNTSNCWGGLYDLDTHISLLIPGNYCNRTICPINNFNQAYFSYLPSLPGNAFFAALFATLLVRNLALSICYRTRGFLVTISPGLVLELRGYVSRVTMHNQPFIEGPFLSYLICLTIAPAFLSAAIYLCLGHLVMLYGEHLSRFPARTYSLVFIFCDFISLLLQGIGGGLAATARTPSKLNTGTNIMIAGLSFQCFSLLLFSLLSFDFFQRVRNSPSPSTSYFDVRQTPRFRALLYALPLATLTIFIRCAYRVAELSHGFGNHLFRDGEVEYMILEPTMIAIAVIALMVCHPGPTLGRDVWKETGFRWRWWGKENVQGKMEGQKQEGGVEEEERKKAEANVIGV